MRNFYLFILLSAATSFARADVITLKDGTQLEGQAVKNGDMWWVRTNDGKTHTISVSEVTSISSGTIESNKPVIGNAAATRPAGAVGYNGTKSKADSAETPLAAIAIWEKFLESTAAPAEMNSALQEIANYMKYIDQGAEKINGKWLAGEERKALLKKATDLASEGADLIKAGKVPVALKKMEDAGRIYPNSYPLIFQYGWAIFHTSQPKDAFKYFEAAVRNRPYSPEALNNLAFLVLANQNWERGMLLLYQAAQTADSDALAKNMAKTVFGMAPEVRNNPRLKQAIEAAQLLSARYKVDPTTDWSKKENGYTIIGDRPEPIEGYVPYSLGLQTGAGVIIREDGLILTSRHTVEHADVVMVVLDDSTRRIADVLAMDPDQNVALLRIKPTQKLPVLALAKTDAPAERDRCYALGYPRIDRLNCETNLVEGVIRDKSRVVVTNDVVFEGILSPGYSGGPILDSAGQIAALVSFRDYCSTAENKYASALSAGRLRAFLARNKVVLPAGDAAGQLSAEEIAKSKSSIVRVIVANRPG